MSTVTYTLTNDTQITMSWPELDPAKFFEKVIDEGERLDGDLVRDLQVKSIHISYQFPAKLMLPIIGEF